MKTPITPGEILLADYLKPMGIWSPRRPHLRCASVSVCCRGNLSPLRLGSQNALGRALGVSPRSINEIVLGRRAITPEMSLKLGKFFKQSPQFWFNIQTNCDFRRLMKQASRITAKVKSDFTKLAA